MHYTQFTLNDRERWLLTNLMSIAVSFLCQLSAGVELDKVDIKIVKILIDLPEEIAALVVKMNRDRLQDDDLP